MSDLTRRSAIKAVVGVGVLSGVSLAHAADEKSKVNPAITTYNRIEVVCKNVLGHRACLYFLEENDKFYLELTYRGKAAKVEISDTEQELANWFGIKFKVKISNISHTGGVFAFRVRLIADVPVLPDITIIDEDIRIDLESLKLDAPDDKKPVLTFTSTAK